MKQLRTYGDSPYRVAVIHGGPGVSGEMAPVAEELSKSYGVLEPLQTKNSLNGQIRELKHVIKNNGKIPIILIGWSWGAWLSFIFTALNPAYVEKLILVGSGPFEEKYVSQIIETRLSRLSKEDGKKVSSFTQIINSVKADKKNDVFCRFGAILSKADLFNPSSVKDDLVDCQFNIYQGVWGDARRLRSTGKLLRYGRQIDCPVVVIHGTHDPHPAAGVIDPLSRVVKNFKSVLLDKCGHKPWYEKEASDKFYEVLRQELDHGRRHGGNIQ